MGRIVAMSALGQKRTYAVMSALPPKVEARLGEYQDGHHLLRQRFAGNDLRRTCATRMADLGIQRHVIEATLNHISGHKAGVAGTYNRSTYAAEKRAALDLWGNHIRVIVAQSEGANIHRLKRTKPIPA